MGVVKHLRKSLYILFVFGIGINFCYSQSDSEKRFGLTEFDLTKLNRIYRIQVEDYQVLELIDSKSGEFRGTLTHLVWKTNRKGIRKDSIVQKISVPNSVANKLISELKKSGFENLKDCSEVEGCISGFDGTTTFFTSIDEENVNSASYWELESDYYYIQNKKKVPAEVVNAREMISLVNKEFDLKEQFQDFKSRLPNGRYAYSMIIMKKG